MSGVSLVVRGPITALCALGLGRAISEQHAAELRSLGYLNAQGALTEDGVEISQRLAAAERKASQTRDVPASTRPRAPSVTNFKTKLRRKTATPSQAARLPYKDN